MAAILGATPVLGLAIIAWIIMGIRRQRPDESFNAATAVSWYAHIMLIVGAIMGMVGGALAVKAAFGFADIGFSYPPLIYYGPQPGPPGPATSRDDDLTLGITLLAVGTIVLVAHALVVRALAARAGAAPAWISRGTLMLFTFFSGMVALVASVMSVYEGIGYWRGIGDHHFGEPVGVALMFLPVWIIVTARLLRTTPLRGSHVPRAPQRPAAGSTA